MPRRRESSHPSSSSSSDHEDETPPSSDHDTENTSGEEDVTEAFTVFKTDANDHQNATQQLRHDVAERVLAYTLRSVDASWRRCVGEEIEPTAQAAWRWLDAHAFAPAPEVPVLYAAMGSSSATDDADVIFTAFQEAGSNGDRLILRLDSADTISFEKILRKILQLLPDREPKEAEQSLLEGVTACLQQRKTHGLIAIIVEGAEGTSPHLLEALINLCLGWRSSQWESSEAADLCRRDIPAIPMTLVFGLNVSTVKSLRAQFQRADSLTRVISTGVQLVRPSALISRFARTLKEGGCFQGKHPNCSSSVCCQSAIGVDLPTEFLEYLIDLACDSWNLSLVKEAVQQYLLVFLSHSQVPGLFCPLELHSGSCQPKEKKRIEELLSSIRICFSSDADVDAVSPKIYDALRQVYERLTGGMFADEGELMDLSIFRICEQWRMHWVNREMREGRLCSEQSAKLLSSVLDCQLIAAKKIGARAVEVTQTFLSHLEEIRNANQPASQDALEKLRMAPSGFGRGESALWDSVFGKQHCESAAAFVVRTHNASYSLALSSLLGKTLKRTLASSSTRSGGIEPSNGIKDLSLLYHIMKAKTLSIMTKTTKSNEQGASNKENEQQQRRLTHQKESRSTMNTTSICDSLYVSAPTKYMKLQDALDEFVQHLCLLRSYSSTSKCTCKRCLLHRFYIAVDTLVMLGVIAEPSLSSAGGGSSSRSRSLAEENEDPTVDDLDDDDELSKATQPQTRAVRLPHELKTQFLWWQQ